MSEKFVRPMKGRVYLEVLRDEERETKGGILLPEASRGRRREALVLAIGEEVDDVVPTDLVIFDPYKILAVLADTPEAQAPGTPLARGGDRCVVDADSILAVVTDIAPKPNPSEVMWALETLRRVEHAPDRDMDEDCACGVLEH